MLRQRVHPEVSLRISHSYVAINLKFLRGLPSLESKGMTCSIEMNLVSTV